MVAEPFFTLDGQQFAPTPQARGPWDPNSLHGRVLIGLLAREFEQQYGDADFQFSRLTTDLFRVPPFAPIELTTSVAREGNRIRVIDGSVTAGGVVVAQSRAVMLRRAEQPEGEVWAPPPWDAPAPDELAAPTERERRDGRTPMWETRPIGGASDAVAQKRAWVRESRTLLDDEPLTPFMRAAIAADFTNPFANSGESGLNFVNADVTLYLHRLPVGEWVGFEVSGHHSAQGVAVAECTVYDEEGPIGRSTVCSVANTHRR
ncbi:MAG TPA: thioesterase family protein [Dehalococcoidia bacterium]|nr:thioesterase family protein [Dehalococcoidia bacterium]